MDMDKEQIKLSALQGFRRFLARDEDEILLNAVTLYVIEDLYGTKVSNTSERIQLESIIRKTLPKRCEIREKNILERLKEWYENNFCKSYQNYVRAAEIYNKLAVRASEPVEKKSFKRIFNELMIAITG